MADHVARGWVPGEARGRAKHVLLTAGCCGHEFPTAWNSDQQTYTLGTWWRAEEYAVAALTSSSLSVVQGDVPEARLVVVLERVRRDPVYRVALGTVARLDSKGGALRDFVCTEVER